MTDESTKQPWEWSESHWRGLVDQVRAGRPLKPTSWPGGARCAVALSFDCDHETNELRDGGRSIGRMSWGEFGARVGIERVLACLDRHGVPATFFTPAVAALLHPDEPKRLVDAGHEIGIHGWIHELNSVLPAETERELMLRSADVLEKLTGVRPCGMRTASWDFSPSTLTIQREMGLLYDSSLMADDECYELLQNGEPTGIVEIPVEWIRDDGAYLTMLRMGGLRPYTPPREVLQIFIDEFDAAWEDGGLFQLTCHPHVVGYRSRILILEELLRHIKAKGSSWFATHADVARHVTAASPL
ncbi:polysaccharide deacetylase family protein [Acuticoccus mangrovi]|uniref:Chitooligosaccharide deacetylase n=1 Tax=Acuticoccus mangrovi TaxID=2796142 RepID=A0A934IRP7_9HYPH|nr:polysaccharide deacetylase [Acuticoccus mangrovi]MBJ3777022.1 polysaccharide deacetylase [Acuticoccus mangrovi]